MDAKQLIALYPFLDEMMAETLIKSYENGTLTEHLKKLPEETPQPTASILPGAIEVLPPEEKSCAVDIDRNERADFEDDLP